MGYVCVCVCFVVCMYERSTGINQDRPESYVTFGVARHFVQGHVAAVQYFRQCVSGSHDEKIPTVHVGLCLHTCCPALHALPPLCLCLYILIRCVCVCVPVGKHHQSWHDHGMELGFFSRGHSSFSVRLLYGVSLSP